MPSSREMYRQVVDAQTGEILYRQSLVNYSSGRAFRNYPGAAKGGTAETFDLSGNGWLSPTAKILSGPNAHVYADENDNNVADQTEEINRDDHATGRNNWLWTLQTFNPAVAGCNLFICTWDPGWPAPWARTKNKGGSQPSSLSISTKTPLKPPPSAFTLPPATF